MNINLQKKNVLITGAAYGIGAAVVKLLAQEGCRLFLIDKDKAKLEETAEIIREKGTNPILLVKDLSQASDRELVFASTAENNFSLDILINNVGVGYWRHFKDTPWKKMEEIININVKCMTHMTKLALPAMLEKNEGLIVNLSSTAAFIGAPNAVCYSATKAYIRLFTETLEMELHNTGVKALCVFPGATTTHFWEYAQMSGGKYETHVRKMTAEDVAKEAVLAMKRGKSSVITGLKNKVNMLIVKFLPRNLITSIALKRFES